jgi:hypothetical protein
MAIKQRDVMAIATKTTRGMKRVCACCLLGILRKCNFEGFSLWRQTAPLLFLAASLMNENKPPFLSEPKIGPPRSVRIGSLCENYVIWSALAHDDCVTVRCFG